MGKRGAKLTSVEDFALHWDPEESQRSKEQSVEQMKQMFSSLASASKEKEKFNNKRTRENKPKSLKK